jgi:mannose-6-phosphate isomerase-like protein (cupin superfamily)
MMNDVRGVSREVAPHYVWGDGCDGWRLVDGHDLSVIEERVPAGRGEVRHAHARARQCFYILSGRAVLETDHGRLEMAAGQGAHVPPGVPHRFVNAGDDEVRFLVISAPSTRGDRIEQP